MANSTKKRGWHSRRKGKDPSSTTKGQRDYVLAADQQTLVLEHETSNVGSGERVEKSYSDDDPPTKKFRRDVKPKSVVSESSKRDVAPAQNAYITTETAVSETSNGDATTTQEVNLTTEAAALENNNATTNALPIEPQSEKQATGKFPHTAAGSVKDAAASGQVPNVPMSSTLSNPNTTSMLSTRKRIMRRYASSSGLQQGNNQAASQNPQALSGGNGESTKATNAKAVKDASTIENSTPRTKEPSQIQQASESMTGSMPDDLDATKTKPPATGESEIVLEPSALQNTDEKTAAPSEGKGIAGQTAGQELELLSESEDEDADPEAVKSLKAFVPLGKIKKTEVTVVHESPASSAAGQNIELLSQGNGHATDRSIDAAEAAAALGVPDALQREGDAEKTFRQACVNWRKETPALKKHGGHEHADPKDVEAVVANESPAPSIVGQNIGLLSKDNGKATGDLKVDVAKTATVLEDSSAETAATSQGKETVRQAEVAGMTTLPRDGTKSTTVSSVQAPNGGPKLETHNVQDGEMDELTRVKQAYRWMNREVERLEAERSELELLLEGSRAQCESLKVDITGLRTELNEAKVETDIYRKLWKEKVKDKEITKRNAGPVKVVQFMKANKEGKEVEVVEVDNGVVGKVVVGEDGVPWATMNFTRG